MDTETITPEEEATIKAVVDAIGYNEAAYDKLVKSYGAKPMADHGDKALQVFDLVQKHPDFEQKFNDLVAKPVMHKLQEHAPKHFVQFFLWLAKVAVKVLKAIVQVAKIIKKAVEQHKAKVAAAKQQAAAEKAKQIQASTSKRNWSVAAALVFASLAVAGIVIYKMHE